MRVPSWFNWRASGRSDAASWVTCCAPRERTDEEMTLALRLIPLYQVRLSLDEASAAPQLWWPLGWRATLTASLGAERAQRVLADLLADGVAVLAVCPRELAEHYRDELARHALPCEIQPV